MELHGRNLADMSVGQIVDAWGRAKDNGDVVSGLTLYQETLARGHIDTLVPMLPVMLHWEGRPYTLDNFFHYEDRYRIRYAKKTVWMTSRQVAKTTGNAASSILRCASLPNYSILFVTPLFEQIRRFSAEYVGKFLGESPVRRVITGTETKNSVLYRTFSNGARMHFSFAGQTAERIRGVSCHEVAIDEAQDLSRDHLPLIESTMSASKYEISTYTGTSKTTDGPLQGHWLKSSQAEWFIPCGHCTTSSFPTWNIPSWQHHLQAMIDPDGLDLRDISPQRPALRCYKCRGRISPRFGRWIHRRPGMRWKFDGYHVSQPIMPMHCEDPGKWMSLIDKLRNYPTTKFLNEILGEASDLAAKLVTQTDMQAAAKLGPNDPRQAKANMRKYIFTCLGIDWGGGGEEEVSWTALSLVGMRRDGRIEVIWGRRLMTPNDHIREAQEILQWWKHFQPDYLAHDYNGSGAVREVFLHQSRQGVKLSQIVPCVYVRAATTTPVYHVPPTEHHPRDHYRVDKVRALLTVTALIKMGWITTFDYDYVDADNPGLLHDFVALTQEKTAMSVGDLYKIDKQEGLSDDFAHATTYACVCLWHRTHKWPNLPEINAIRASEQTISKLEGDWSLDDLMA